jgi:hypothetical protein
MRDAGLLEPKREKRRLRFAFPAWLRPAPSPH